MSHIGRHPVAVNPLQFMATADGWFDFADPPPLGEILDAVVAAGFHAVQPGVPDGGSPAAYRRALAAAGLTAGPGYVALAWSEDAEVRRHQLERARAQARVLTECGAELAFLALDLTLDHPRAHHPARGWASSLRRVDGIADLLGEAARALAAEGVTAALHPHVGTWVETERETAHVLDRAGVELAFGPDLGHLAWAGADLPGLLGAYRERIAGLHLKDMALSVAERARAEGLDYRGTVAGGLWREPGEGDLPLADLVAALGPGSDCWLVIEVDNSRHSPRESLLRCGAAVRALDTAFGPTG
ncbi:sugar phosphate isomerase/epimerase [Streptomyces sp. DSM 44915]|uniref:Sugar phosphate isomerase/epimerase n=1 Tax=Streptomyces chisholmiae TaxID=3075540 RepID=A0ABU2JS20_9ACTN|nr:sugar phosphate isomerase/epimerase [Streptomyces sp. DSM 44915]MDT0267519.1 sugar phosphate isomerase/epimerase [Streptomyces sp. DSM 44915]